VQLNWTVLALLGWSTAPLLGADVTEAERKKIEAQMAGTYNPLSFFDGKLVFDVQERLRFEFRENNFDFNDAADAVTDDAWLLQRVRLGVLYSPLDWLKVYVQGQDVWEIDSTRPDVPFVSGSEGNDFFDLRQALVEVGDVKKFPVAAKIGRQELSYGDERLIGAFDWNNFGRSFDAFKVRYEPKRMGFWVDGFYSNVVTIEPRNQTENWDWEFNQSNDADHFLGLYTSSVSLIPIQTTEAYLLFRDKDGNEPLYSSTTTTPAFGPAPAYDVEQQVWTLGLRVKSTAGKLAGFDYDFEGAFQAGTVRPTPASSALDHKAFALHAGGGYTFEELWSRPRLGIEYNVASGDEEVGDGDNESFMNLFPTNHKFYGYMDVFAWKNLHNPAVQLKCTPWQDSLQPYRLLFVQLDYHLFWLYTNEDAWYRANGVTAVRPVNAAARNADRFAGSELDLTIGYNPTKWLKLLGGYSHFFAGDYLDDTGAGDDADFVYVQSALQF